MLEGHRLARELSNSDQEVLLQTYAAIPQYSCNVIKESELKRIIRNMNDKRIFRPDRISHHTHYDETEVMIIAREAGLL